ncbi:MAG: hypothetical protein WAV46_04620 [Candidatus Moraniibacteriota bacterium]
MKFFAYSIVAVLLAAASGLASAETFAVAGGTVQAVKSGDNVTITVTSEFPAVTLVHFQKKGGIVSIPMQDGSGALSQVSEQGTRFQLKDASGKWLLVTPSGNAFKMTGVTQECKKSKEGCALEVKYSKS